jgi:hypothetical protein
MHGHGQALQGHRGTMSGQRLLNSGIVALNGTGYMSLWALVYVSSPMCYRHPAPGDALLQHGGVPPPHPPTPPPGLLMLMLMPLQNSCQRLTFMCTSDLRSTMTMRTRTGATAPLRPQLLPSRRRATHGCSTGSSRMGRSSEYAKLAAVKGVGLPGRQSRQTWPLHGSQQQATVLKTLASAGNIKHS